MDDIENIIQELRNWTQRAFNQYDLVLQAADEIDRLDCKCRDLEAEVARLERLAQ